MSSKLLLLLISLILSNPDCFADPVSRALRALEKGKHERVGPLLDKSLDKHYINPGARYAYSMLYFDSTYLHQNLDSAHYFIEQAIADASAPDSLDQWPLEKADLQFQALLDQKSRVDKAAFSRAVQENTVASFQYFIDEYATAPQLANAISRRDQLAFEIASAENSYHSYKQFLDQYPEAIQAPMARERYNRLVFLAKTENGKLQHFMEFLKEHPDTPYRDQAEWQIFQLGTLNDRVESYRAFQRDYPNSKYASLVDDILYHRNKESYMEKNSVSDSLSTVYELENVSLIPIFENNRYGFIDPQGNDRISPTFDSIPEFYLCQLLTSDVLQAFVDDKLVLMSRNQKILWDLPFDGIEDLGRGLLKISSNGKYGVLHKSGWKVLDAEFDQIYLLGNSLLALQKKGKWGIASMTGRLIVPAIHQEIEESGAFVLLRNDHWAISNQQDLIDHFEKDQEFDYRYEDWELVSHHYLMVFKQAQEGLINSRLATVIPLSEHEIHDLDSTDWFVKTAHGTIRFYGDQLQDIPPDRYQDFVSNNHHIGLKKNPAWEVWDRSSLKQVNEINYDSVATLGQHLMILSKDGASSILFRNGSLTELAAKDRVKLIRDPDQSKGFLQVSSSGGKRQVYDLDGNRIYETWYYEVNPLTPRLFIIEKNNLMGIVNLEGKILIKPRYRTIVADSSNHISLLHNGRFGYFNPESGSLIRPQYESRMLYFDENILKSTLKGKKGLVDHRNKVLLPFDYDQIEHWADSMVFASKAGSWQVLNLYSGVVAYQGISGVDWIRGTDSHMAIIKTEQGYGLLDSEKGMLLNPGFNDILNLGTAQQPVFFTEKYIPEADYYVVIYYNPQMEVIRKQVFDSGNYDQVYCF